MESQTSATLLARLRQVPADQAAWAQFADRYGRKIYGWCRQWNLQEADAEDVTQSVLLKLAEKMRAFEYDPDEELPGVAQDRHPPRLARLLVRPQGGRGRRQPGGGAAADGRGPGGPGPAAGRGVRPRAARRGDGPGPGSGSRRGPGRRSSGRPCEGESGAEAAAALGMKVATVFVARSKVQKMLQEEIRKLEGPEGS